MSNATANAAIIGNIIEAVAVLDVTSAKNITKRLTIIKTISICTPCKPIDCSPIQADKPDSTNPSAIAKPPPDDNKIPQGNLSAVFQSSKRSPGLFFDGMINKTSAAKMAIIVSSIFGISFSNKNEREIQASAAKRSEEHTSELQSRGHLVCRLLLE